VRLTIDRDLLLGPLQRARAAAATRTTQPVYTGVKARAAGDALVLCGQDLETGLSVSVPLPGLEEPGEAILPAARLEAILREAPPGPVALDADGRRVRVRTAAAEYESPAEDPAAFSDLPAFPDGAYAEVAAGDLGRVLRRTAFAAAREEGKYAMRAVLWRLAADAAELVATDGKRLAVGRAAATLVGPHEKSYQTEALLPPKAMAHLAGLVADLGDADPVRVRLSAQDALFAAGRSVIYSRLVEGRYPPYRDVIPKKSNAKVPLVVNDFLSAVRQAAIMTDDESKRITFHFAPGRLNLEAQGATTGKSKVAMKLEEYAGPAIDISFDPAYLTEMLRVLDGRDVLQLDLVDGQKSAVFRHGEDYLYLVVPLV
jgi:DNA polymerase-3 subunit beta